MLKTVALIDNEDWDKGALHVNALIAEIVSDQAKAVTEIGEVLTPDPVTGLLDAVSLISRNEDFIETCVKAVESSVLRLLAKGAANEYAAILDTLEILKEDIELDRGNAFSLFNAFSFAWIRIKAAVDKGIVPDPEGDAKLARLITALDKGVADLSGSEHVQTGLIYRHRFAQDGRAEMVTDDVIEYALASAKISTGVLKQELGTDIRPKDANETSEEKAGRELRLMGRLIRIRHYLNNGNAERATAMLHKLDLEPADMVTAAGKLKDMAELIDWVIKIL